MIDWRLSVYKSFIQSNFSYRPLLLGSFVEGKITVSLKNYRNMLFTLFFMTFQWVTEFYLKGQTPCLFQFIVFVSWISRCTDVLMSQTLNDLRVCQFSKQVSRQKEMFRSINFRMLSWHSIMNVAEWYFKLNCSFIMYYLLIVLLHAQFLCWLRLRSFHLPLSAGYFFLISIYVSYSNHVTVHVIFVKLS